MLDRMRDTLFNVLQSIIAGKVFVDLYAGTGAVGIEALSRGASAIFVESNPGAVAVIRDNLKSLGAEQDAQVLPIPVAAALAKLDPGRWNELTNQPAGNLYFLGPPYEAAEEYERTLSALGAFGSPMEMVIAQHATQQPLSEQYGRLQRFRTIKLGSNSLSFYRPAERPADPGPDVAGAAAS
jgi:16S rRNA (guanine(966)-N(2))-methyltransferase RsmD